MLLSDIKKEKNEVIKAQSLKQYCRSTDVDVTSLRKFLELEIAKTKSLQWQLSCKSWIVWLDHYVDSLSYTFDKDQFLESLADDLSIEKKIQVVKQGLKHITERDEDVMLFFEFNLATNNPKERLLYRKVLNFFEKKGFWKPRYKNSLSNEESIDFDTFVTAPREARLHWLDSAPNSISSRSDLSEWGLTALTFEPDSFIVSKLVKVLAEVFTASKLYYGRLVDVIHIFTKDQDARVRSNSIEALGIIMQKRVAVEQIESIILQTTTDSDPRVRMTALLEMFHSQPDSSLSLAKSIVEKVQDKDDLEGIRWLIKKSLDLDQRFKVLLELCDERLEQIAIFYPDDELDWIT